MSGLLFWTFLSIPYLEVGGFVLRLREPMRDELTLEVECDDCCFFLLRLFNSTTKTTAPATAQLTDTTTAGTTVRTIESLSPTMISAVGVSGRTTVVFSEDGQLSTSQYVSIDFDFCHEYLTHLNSRWIFDLKHRHLLIDSTSN